MYHALRLVSAIFLAVAATGVSQSRAESPSFSTPSGNILCYVPVHLGSFDAEADLFCHIFSADWTPPSEEFCDLDRTATIALGPKGNPSESMFCHGDVFWPVPTPVVSYGSSWSVLGYRCEIAESGVTCVNRDGHGFEIARRGRKLF
ncbi:hypothetical protein JJJ17_11265 [Paracoccus caeni]|uniref:Uncharacterized protein n=1 Tax=Paracoccus caeni TaxID=657651 RepID=A0A934SGC0_9RHOB|nr:DUF6636 domain-containing protein [Paracoccus caeni]MBK4216506.1 hypothetical protein [Paracoccus caeni]